MNTALVLTSMDALAVHVVRALGEKGFDSVVAGSASGRLTRLSRRCRAHARVAASGAELAEGGDAVLDRLATLARGHGCSLAAAVDVPGALCAAKLRARLPGIPFFPCPEPAALRLLDDKWTFYGFLTENGLPTPQTWLIEDRARAAALPLPLMLKPRADGFSRGVRAVRDASSREAALSGADPYLRLPVLAQEFVDGEDVDLSFLADRGRLVAWTVQTRAKDGTLTFLDDERVVELGRRMAAASDYTGLAHVDMRYDGPARAAVKVIEFNPRFWGSFAYSQGLVDFVGLGLELANGRAPAAAARAPVGACPGLRGVLRRAARGNFDVPPGSRAFLRQKLADPLPELVKAALHLAGAHDDGA